MKKLTRASSPFRLLAFALLFPALAQAHTGLDHTHGFTAGVVHPLFGLDHLCAMIAVGLWAVQRGGRAVWMVPLSFVAVMMLGGALGMAGFTLPGVEIGIVASVLVLGALIAAAVRLPVAASAVIVGMFALFHGYAHGAEMPENASGLFYAIGFTAATAALHFSGIALGLLVRRWGKASLVRYAGGAIAACGLAMAGAIAAEPANSQSPIDVPGVHNAFRVNERLLSGSQPEGDAAFAALAKLGVKTIVSVDGAKPDVETARKFGLRYIHLPFGYDGIPADRVAQLARAASISEGAIFVHCHHGKHRGPAAVAIMCEATADWTPARAEAWLRQAGTADDYPGLYRAAREFQPVSAAELSRVGDLPEVTKTPELVDVMIAIDERFDLLKAVQKAGWNTPPGHADLTPAHEATLLWEQFREMERTADTAKRGDKYRAKLVEAGKAADALRIGLQAATLNSAALDAAFKSIGVHCASCHEAHRNKKQLP